MANAQGIRAGRAFVEVGSDESALQKGLRAAETRLKSFGSSVTGLGVRLDGLGAAVTSPFLVAAKSFADAGSELNDMSARTGIGVETLSALSFAAQQTGASIADVETGVRKMQKALTAGSLENQTAAGTFAELGLSVENLMRLSPENQFNAVATAIGKISNPTARAAAAMQIFGKSGTQLVPMISDLKELTTQARDFGLVWTGEEAEKADALGDAFDLLKASASRVVSTIGSALAPILTDAATGLARVITQVIRYVQANGSFIATVFKAGLAIVAAGGAIIALGAAISGIGAILGGIASGIGVLSTLFGAILSPIGLVIAALGALAAWFVTSTEVGKQTLAYLGEGFNSLLSIATQAFSGIASALKAGDIALAGKILWAGLKVTWIKGINYLSAVWADWGTATIEVFRGISYQIAGFFIDAWASIQTAAVNTVSGIQASWVNYVNMLMKTWNSFGGFFAKVWEKIKALFSGKDITEEINKINADVAAKNKAQDESAQGKLAGIGQINLDRVAQIEADRKQANASLGDQQQAETDARRKAAQDRLAKGASDLAAAQQELTGLVGQAGTEAANAAIPTPKQKIGSPAEFNPEDISKSLSETKAKVDVAGSFSAAALSGLGAGTSRADDQLREQKKTNQELQKLNHKAQTGQLVFN